MTSIAFLSLFVFLTTLLASVESLRVPSALYTSSLLAATSAKSGKSLINSYLNQAKDDDGSDALESASSPADEVDFDWKAIAAYVFDESVDTLETMTMYQAEDEEEDSDDDESEKIEKPHLHSKPIILFDGVCNLCNGGVNFAIDYDSAAKFRFASLQSNVAKSLILRDGKDPKTLSDVVLVTSDKVYYSAEAVARIMAELDTPVLKFFGILGQVTPQIPRNLVYKVVSKNRFILGENDSCRLDFDGEYTSRFVSDPPQSITSKKKEDEDK